MVGSDNGDGIDGGEGSGGGGGGGKRDKYSSSYLMHTYYVPCLSILSTFHAFPMRVLQ